jgi:hypothetical protein
MEEIMTRNLKLKIAIIESGKTQKEVANESGIHPSLLSMAINGRYNLTEPEKYAVAQTIGLHVEDVFSE